MARTEVRYLNEQPTVGRAYITHEFLTFVENRTDYRRVNAYGGSFKSEPRGTDPQERRARARAFARGRTDALRASGRSDALLDSMLSPLNISLADLQTILDEDFTEK